MIDLMAYGRARKIIFSSPNTDDGRKTVIFFVCHTITLILQGTLFTGSMLKDKMLFEQMQNRLIY